LGEPASEISVCQWPERAWIVPNSPLFMNRTQSDKKRNPNVPDDEKRRKRSRLNQ